MKRTPLVNTRFAHPVELLLFITNIFCPMVPSQPILSPSYPTLPGLLPPIPGVVAAAAAPLARPRSLGVLGWL